MTRVNVNKVESLMSNTKGCFFSESAMKFFSDPQIPKKKKMFQKTILSLKFKFQAKNSFLEYIFLRFGDLKNELHFLKKSHLYRSTYRVKFGLKGVFNL